MNIKEDIKITSSYYTDTYSIIEGYINNTYFKCKCEDIGDKSFCYSINDIIISDPSIILNPSSLIDDCLNIYQTLKWCGYFDK